MENNDKKLFSFWGFSFSIMPGLSAASRLFTVFSGILSFSVMPGLSAASRLLTAFQVS